MVKKLLPSIILLLILAAGVGYAYCQNFFKKEDTAATTAESKLLTLEDSEVQSIVIRSNAAGGNDTASDTTAANAAGKSTATKSTDEATSTTSSSENDDSTQKNGAAAEQSTQMSADMIQLEQTEGQWSMTSPAAYPINTYMINDWLSTLKAATVHSTVEEQPSDLSKYGLHADKPNIVLTTSSGQMYTLLLGDEVPTKGYYYARLNDGPVIELSQQNINDLSGTAFQFIDTTPIGWDDEQLSKVVWKSSAPSANWTLTHKANSADPSQDEWMLNGKALASDLASNMTDAIKNMPTTELPVPAAQVQSYKQILTLDVQLLHGEKTTVEHYTGWQSPQDQDHVWIVDPSGKWAYQLMVNNISTAAQSADTASSTTAEK
ncbi:DUF4340 domain-containing protein [Paenibacillus sp. WLX1005]|uniref:DUF4340 domain-containing protein n=1 Tax=Paenibacillus sp. WLX1005 TaxID=3243766 RepID=UPI00398437FA